jgi:hypothetical protein
VAVPNTKRFGHWCSVPGSSFGPVPAAAARVVRAAAGHAVDATAVAPWLDLDAQLTAKDQHHPLTVDRRKDDAPRAIFRLRFEPPGPSQLPQGARSSRGFEP